MTDHDHDRERRAAALIELMHADALMPQSAERCVNHVTQPGHPDRHRHLCAALAVAYSQHQINDLRGEP